MNVLTSQLKRLQSSVSDERWSPVTLYLFRALFIFIVIGERGLLLEVFSLGGVSGLAAGSQSIDPYVVWFGQSVFDIDLADASTNLGDSLYSWTHSWSYLSLSVVGAFIWSLLSRAQAHPLLKDGLWTLMRLMVAFYMFGYGFAKVYGVQFVLPSSLTMMRELGELSPLELMKVFMGTSQPYSLMGGWLEVIGGVLLCLRRTYLLGALLLVAVLSNVVALNLFYAFGVMRFSLELTLICAALTLPHAQQLIKVLILHQATEPVALYGPWTDLRWRRGGAALMSLWLVGALWIHSSNFKQFAYDYGDAGPRGPLDGTWVVTEMSRDGAQLPTLIGDPRRWRSLSLDQRPKWTEATVSSLDGETARWRFIVRDELIEFREMTFDDDLSKAELKGSLRFQVSKGQLMQLKGTLEGSQIEATLKLKPQKSFKLLSIGPRWIKL